MKRTVHPAGLRAIVVHIPRKGLYALIERRLPTSNRQVALETSGVTVGGGSDAQCAEIAACARSNDLQPLPGDVDY